MANTIKGNTNPTTTTIDIDALPLLIDVDTAALIRGNSPKFIRDMLRKGEIKGAKLGQSWRINTAAFLEQCGLA